MALASASRHDWTYVLESTPGTTPTTPTMTVARFLQANFGMSRAELLSDEKRSDRQRGFARLGFKQTQGSFPATLAPRAHDDFIEAAMMGTYASVTVGTTGNLTIDNTAKTLTRASGSWITDGVRKGSLLTTSSFSNSENNRIGIPVLAVNSATELLIGDEGTDFVDETSAATVVYPGTRLNTGTTLRHFTMQRRWNDVGKFQPHVGTVMNGMEISYAPGELVRLNFPAIGYNAGAISGTDLDSTPVAAATDDPFAPFDGFMYKNGVKIATLTAATINLANNHELVEVCFADVTPEIVQGDADITGSFTFIFESETIYNTFLNETDVDVLIKSSTKDGSEFMGIALNKLRMLTGDLNPPVSGPFPVSMNFRSLLDADSQTLTIQRGYTP